MDRREAGPYSQFLEKRTQLRREKIAAEFLSRESIFLEQKYGVMTRH